MDSGRETGRTGRTMGSIQQIATPPEAHPNEIPKKRRINPVVWAHESLRCQRSLQVTTGMSTAKDKRDPPRKRQAGLQAEAAG